MKWKVGCFFLLLLSNGSINKFWWKFREKLPPFLINFKILLYIFLVFIQFSFWRSNENIAHFCISKNWKQILKWIFFLFFHCKYIIYCDKAVCFILLGCAFLISFYIYIYCSSGIWARGFFTLHKPAAFSLKLLLNMLKFILFLF